jgi:hypothetical protein
MTNEQVQTPKQTKILGNLPFVRKQLRSDDIQLETLLTRRKPTNNSTEIDETCEVDQMYSVSLARRQLTYTT